jgi:hypothetical protein
MTVASSGRNRTRTDLLRVASTRARRRGSGTTLGIGSLLVTTPSLTHVGADPVPRRSPTPVPSRPHTPDTGRRPVHRATTRPARSVRTARSVRPHAAAASTPTPHGTTDRFRRVATPMATAHPDPCPTPTTTASARLLSELEAQQESRARGGMKSESVDNTREKRAAVDSSRNPPVPHHPRQREVVLPAYLAPPGAQQGTARLSRKFDPSGPTFGGPGERLDPPHRRRRTGYYEQRDPQDSVTRSSCPQIFADDPESRLDTRRSTHECQCRHPPAASPTAREGRTARPGNNRERLGPPRCRRSYKAGEPRPRPTPMLRTARRGIRSPMAPESRDNRPGRAGGTTPP